MRGSAGGERGVIHATGGSPATSRILGFRRRRMTARLRGRIAAAAVLVSTAAALEAGGWVVVTIQDVPDHAVTGRSLTLTYAVRQHGIALVNGLSGGLEARSGAVVVRAPVVPTREPGHYSATLTLPHAGQWTLEIISGFGGQLDRVRISIPVIDAGMPVPGLAEIGRGRRLFVAKGCMTCHIHRDLAGPSAAVGPDLSARRYLRDDVTQFLARPPQPRLAASDRPRMPDLKLQAAEVVSLAAFIAAEP